MNGKYHIPWIYLANVTWGTLSLTTNSSWLPWGEGCHASCQPSDASTSTYREQKFLVNDKTAAFDCSRFCMLHAFYQLPMSSYQKFKSN